MVKPANKKANPKPTKKAPERPAAPKAPTLNIWIPIDSETDALPAGNGVFLRTRGGVCFAAGVDVCGQEGIYQRLVAR